jgi:hypothetical protein
MVTMIFVATVLFICTFLEYPNHIISTDTIRRRLTDQVISAVDRYYEFSGRKVSGISSGALPSLLQVLFFLSDYSICRFETNCCTIYDLLE